MPKRKKTEKKVEKIEEEKKENLSNVIDLRKEDKNADASKKETSGKKKFPLKNTIGIIAAVLIIINLGFAYGMYVQGWMNTPIKIFAKIFPYPAARAGLHLVSMDEYYKDIESFTQYYKTAQKVDFTTAEGKTVYSSLKKDILDRLLDQKVIISEAGKMKVTVTNQDVDNEYNKLVQNSGEETLKKQIKDYYNWDVPTFKNEIRKALFQTKLQDAVNNDDSLNSAQIKKTKDILARIKNGEDFAAVAKDISEATDAADGGSLGWISKATYEGTYDSSVLDKIFTMEKGQVSETLKTADGFEIFKVEDKKDDQVLARRILIKYTDFRKWLDSKKKEYGIQKFVDSEKVKLPETIK